MTLSSRLEAILDLIDPVDILADIGCDHGLLIIEAVQRGLCKHGLAIDNKPGPLSKAETNINRFNLKDKITCILSDGALSLNQMSDAWVIAGMGGETILEIVTKSIEKAKRQKYLIVSAHSKLEELRTQMALLGFECRKEVLVLDYKIYTVLVFSYNGVSRTLDIKDSVIGMMEKNELYYQYVQSLLSKYEFVSEVRQAKDSRIVDTIDCLKECLAEQL